MSRAGVPALRVAMIGYAFMGATHSQAWRTAAHVADLPLRPELAVVVGRQSEAVAEAARRLGWAASETDWRRVVDRDDIDLVDICTPGNTHAEIAVAALAAGKHVLCEKPLANSVAEAEAMVTAAEQAGVQAMVGFTYRRTPAVALARQLVADGTIGAVRQVRAQYLQDWLADEQVPLTWRLDKDRAGSGALGDIGAHIVDAVEFVTGQRLTGVSGIIDTFVKERPVAAEGGPTAGAGLGGTAGDGFGPVTVDDAAVFFGKLESGALAAFEATRYALGRKNAMRFEINGTQGSLAFDFEQMNVLEHYDARRPADATGFTRIIVTEPSHPYLSYWWPPGHGLGYEHGFTHQVIDLVNAIGSGGIARPTFADGLHVQRVLAAVEASSAANSSWQSIPSDNN